MTPSELVEFTNSNPTRVANKDALTPLRNGDPPIMRRITELDAIRGLAAMSVMIYHLKPQAFALHGVRVDLFFVLSGFLVTTILLRKVGNGRALAAFAVRRCLRIWPAYFLALGLLVLGNPWLSKPFAMDALPYYLTFTQNIQRYWSNTVPDFCGYFGHTWSLAIEEQLYLVWPLIVLVVGRRGLVPVTLGLVALSVLMRSLGFHWWLLVARCDGFALGGLLAVIFLDGEQVERHRKRLQLGFGLFTVVAIPMVAATTYATLETEFGGKQTIMQVLMVLTWNLFYFGLVGLVVLHTGHPALRILRDARLRYLGKISYGLYIYHSFVFIVMWAIGRALHLNEPIWFDVLRVAVTILVASLSWHFIEEPITRLKSRVRYEPPAPDFSTAVPPLVQSHLSHVSA